MGNALAGSGFLSKTNRIGYYRPDTSDYNRASAQGLKPALAAHGLKLTDEFTFDPSNIGNSYAQLSNAVLQFQSEHIDRVLFQSIGSSTGFTTAASQAHYSPRYGFTSDIDPYSAAQYAPSGSLNGAQFAGWLPAYDVGASQIHQPLSPNETICRKAMAAEKVDISSDAAAQEALSICDDFLMMQFVFARTNTPTPDAMSQVFSSDPRVYLSPITFASDMSGLHDGAAGYRLGAWSSSCSCLTYTSGVKPIPR
jgi:hypothetical protein